MDLQDPLCELPAVDEESCCAPEEQPPAAPLWPSNPPGLAAIAYRIGTFTSFRRAMLDEVARPDLLEGVLDVVPPPANPFAARWHEGRAGDYHTQLIELWAYLADIMTFYQERIANEAYLPTATQRESARRLAELLGYRPQPGAAASALLAFSAAAGKSVVVPAAFRAGSRATRGKAAAVFETAQALTALGDYSAVPLSAKAPTNQFAALSALAALSSPSSLDSVFLAQAASQVYGLLGATFLLSLPVTTFYLSGRALSGSVSAGASRSVVLAGTANRLTSGDYVLLVENEGATGQRSALQQITAVTTDKTANTTTITWSEAPGASYANVSLYALRVTAGAFGNNAPAFASLPATLTGTVNGVDGPYKGKDWDDSTKNEYYLPTPDQSASYLFLDGVYDEARGMPEAPGWAVLLVDGQAPRVVQFTDARPSSVAAYSVSGRVTRLTLTAGLPTRTFPFRSTVVLTGAATLTLQNMLPLPDPLTGKTLILSGLYPQLQDGQQVILSGKQYDPTTVPPSPQDAAESAILDGPPALDETNQITTVTLRSALANQYVRSTAVLMANVVEATQGETVRDEVLGSGDGSAFQAFALKKSPLTYLPATGAEGLAATVSTLQVTVNNVRWAEQPTLLESATNAQVYTTAQDETGKTTVTFGDGINGARPPTGRDNIHARYRKGLGTSGNVGSAGIQQLIDSATGLQKVTNPLPAAGGEDAEALTSIQTNAPESVLTFGRAISAADYAALARTFPGIGKAGATWVLRDPQTLQALAFPYVQLTVATTDGAPLSAAGTLAADLRAFLDARRDPNVLLRLVDHQPVYIEVAATIDVEDNYPRQGTLNAALAALGPGPNPDGPPGFFAFESLEFGESIHLSAVYAALQAVPGVRAATITTLRRLSPPADADLATVRDHIFIRPGELATIENDPTDAGKGTLTLTLGQGGYADT